jgi:thymidylate synthase
MDEASSEACMDLPVVTVTAANLPAAWEQAVIATWERGARIATQYDRPEDPPSRDAMAVITVLDPFAEPRIHKAMPCGITDLEAYRQEVVDGIHDHWIDPAAGKWEYTYHERLARYSVPGLEQPIDQMAYVVDALAATPHTRRAQATTWKPWEDAGCVDPACLQRLWFRVFGDRLVLHADMRSNDAFRASFMNMYAFTDLQRHVASQLSARLGRTIRAGQYIHTASSFHIYGSNHEEFDAFLESVRKRTFEQRTYRTDVIAPLIEEARAEIAASLRREAETGRKGL